MIDEQLKHQEEKKNVLFEYCNTIMNVISIADNVDNNWDEILKELKETMEVIEINMHELQNLKNNINEIEELARNVEQTKDGDEKNKKIHYCERFVLILMVCMNIFLAIFNIKTFLLAS